MEAMGKDLQGVESTDSPRVHTSLRAQLLRTELRTLCFSVIRVWERRSQTVVMLGPVLRLVGNTLPLEGQGSGGNVLSY